MRIVLAAAIASLSLSASAFGQSNIPEAPEPVSNPSCMVEAPVTQDLVSAAGENGFTQIPNPLAPAILHGGISATQAADRGDGAHGSLFFVRDAHGEWRAFYPSESEDTVGLYMAPASGAMIVVTMLQTEGPGPSWTVIHSDDGFTTGFCATVNFPSSLNKPDYRAEYLELHDVDLDARGRGEIVGVAHIDRDTRQGDWWYAYRTQDGGASWGSAHRLSRERAARTGLYQPVADSPAPDDLVQDLQRYAAGR
ncbi:MAG: hypothetical protein ABUS57_08215 [Pseudomonadota bacterium]